MRTLADAIDDKDHYTRDHSERVALFATAIGRILGFHQEQLRPLVHAGRLHDIGKIATPDRILLKPSYLTNEEFAIVKLHCAEGERLVTAIGEPELGTWIRHHHERWDGSGYPDGLAGTRIPLPSRILAAADALDAMTTDRSYSVGVTFEEAAKEIESNGGGQFDPVVASALVGLIRRGGLVRLPSPDGEPARAVALL